MFIYWILFSAPALMAIFYSSKRDYRGSDATQVLALWAFLLFYTLVAGIRYNVGGDWGAYELIYDDIADDSLANAMARAEPVFGFIVWVSSLFGLGIYPANAICAFLIGLGVVRISLQTREPWLAITFAVPYLLIVVGMGYIRQAAAIGLILLAIDSLGRGQRTKTLVCLGFAAGFHLTACVVFPIFGFAMAHRNRLGMVLLTAIGVGAFILVIGPRLASYQENYLEAGYESSGTLVRLLMGFVPSVLLLARRKAVLISSRSRSIWIGMALVNCGVMVVYFISQSSTAVDRISLFFSIVQLIVIGNIREIVGASERTSYLLRIVVVAAAAAVQVVWLVYANNAEYWVPYQSTFRYL